MLSAGAQHSQPVSPAYAGAAKRGALRRREIKRRPMPDQPGDGALDKQMQYTLECAKVVRDTLAIKLSGASRSQ